jgi:DNA-binding NarL/FixJ family response regulator
MRMALYAVNHLPVPLVTGQLGGGAPVCVLIASQSPEEIHATLAAHDINVVLITSLAAPRWIAFERSSEPQIIAPLTRIVLSRQEPTTIECSVVSLGFDGVGQLDGPTSLFDRVTQIHSHASEHGTNFARGAKEPEEIRRLLLILGISFIDQTDFEISIRVATGATDREIARDVRLSGQTVRNRISGLLSRSGCRNRTELAIMHANSPYTTWGTYLALQGGDVTAHPKETGGTESS